MKLSKKFWIVAGFVYFLILLSIMLLAGTGKLVNFPLGHPPYDKLGHFVLYGIASFLCHRATGKKNMNLFFLLDLVLPFCFGKNFGQVVDPDIWLDDYLVEEDLKTSHHSGNGRSLK